MAKNTTLKDENGETIYPRTKSENVYGLDEKIQSKLGNFSVSEDGHKILHQNKPVVESDNTNTFVTFGNADNCELRFKGTLNRPTYNNKELALKDDLGGFNFLGDTIYCGDDTILSDKTGQISVGNEDSQLILKGIDNRPKYTTGGNAKDIALLSDTHEVIANPVVPENATELKSVSIDGESFKIPSGSSGGGGGGNTLYRHDMKLTLTQGSVKYLYVTIFNNNSTAFDITSFKKIFVNSTTYINPSGYLFADTATFVGIGHIYVNDSRWLSYEVFYNDTNSTNSGCAWGSIILKDSVSEV